jgi:hypothetical protein
VRRHRAAGWPTMATAPGPRSLPHPRSSAGAITKSEDDFSPSPSAESAEITSMKASARNSHHQLSNATRGQASEHRVRVPLRRDPLPGKQLVLANCRLRAGSRALLRPPRRWEQLKQRAVAMALPGVASELMPSNVPALTVQPEPAAPPRNDCRPAAAPQPSSAGSGGGGGSCCDADGAACSKAQSPGDWAACRARRHQQGPQQRTATLSGSRSITRERHESQVFDAPSSPSRSAASASPRSPLATAAELVQAAADGNEESTRHYLGLLEMADDGVDVNQLHHTQGHHYPVTALMMAAIGGYRSIVELLLSAGAETEVESRYGTAFEMACRMDQLECLGMLAAAGAELERQDARGQTRLMQAAVRGKVKTVRALLRIGASTETRDGSRGTPFIQACVRGHSEVVAELVRAGCDVSATDDEDGATGLELAVVLGHQHIVDFLSAESQRDCTCRGSAGSEQVEAEEVGQEVEEEEDDHHVGSSGSRGQEHAADRVHHPELDVAPAQAKQPVEAEPEPEPEPE